MNELEEHDAAYSREIEAARVRYAGMTRQQLLDRQRELRTKYAMPTHADIASLEVLWHLLKPK